MLFKVLAVIRSNNDYIVIIVIITIALSLFLSFIHSFFNWFIYFSFSPSLSHTHKFSHTHAHTFFLSFFISLFLPLALSLSLFLYLFPDKYSLSFLQFFFPFLFFFQSFLNLIFVDSTCTENTTTISLREELFASFDASTHLLASKSLEFAAYRVVIQDASIAVVYVRRYKVIVWVTYFLGSNNITIKSRSYSCRRK